jgi:hypothetical protein
MHLIQTTRISHTSRHSPGLTGDGGVQYPQRSFAEGRFADALCRYPYHSARNEGGDNSSIASARSGRLAQLVRAPALQAGGRRFESCTAHHLSDLKSVAWDSSRFFFDCRFWGLYPGGADTDFDGILSGAAQHQGIALPHDRMRADGRRVGEAVSGCGAADPDACEMLKKWIAWISPEFSNRVPLPFFERNSSAP